MALFIRQILDGLCFLHENGIIHRNLKVTFCPLVMVTHQKSYCDFFLFQPRNLLILEQDGVQRLKIGDKTIRLDFHRNNNTASITIFTILADSYFSILLGREMELQMVCGDRTFCAPEVLLTHRFGSSIDLWALGVILYLMYVRDQLYLNAIATI